MSAVIHPGSVRTLPRRRVRAIPKRRGLPVRGFFIFVAATITLAYAFSSALSLGGYMLVENARSSAIKADQRAVLAEASIVELRGEIDRLKSAHSIQRWTAVNNFVTPYRPPDETQAN
ncbi:MAG: hypothetical protein KIT74_10905 [Fimbriimonadales bacterium]|nr:hypothetical protein [Fimbriimonadales bacterium]